MLKAITVTVNPKDRLIVSLDEPDVRKAVEQIELLHEHVGYFRVGTALFMAGGVGFLDMLNKRNINVMLDLKLHDTAHSIDRVFQLICNFQNVKLCTVQALAGHAMMGAAKDAVDLFGRPDLKIVAATVDPALSIEDLRSIGFSGILSSAKTGETVYKLIRQLVSLAQTSGVSGFVCAPPDLEHLVHFARAIDNHAFFVVDMEGYPVSPAEALRAGANFLVYGKSVPGSEDPVARAQELVAAMKETEHGC